jgi:diketogulonate reductase-like aldo/keto reductase
VGARNEEQLRQNLGAVGWSLSPQQIATLDAASAVTAPYPHFPYQRQAGFAQINPPLIAG